MAGRRKTKGTHGGWRPGAGMKPILKDPHLRSVTFEHDQERRLQAFADEEKVSFSEMVRRAVDAYLKRRKR